MNTLESGYQPVPRELDIFLTDDVDLIKYYEELLCSTPNLTAMANWFLRNSVRRQPGIVLASLISTASLMIGRRLKLFSKEANCYCLVLSGTSTGKNAIFNLSKTILKKCGKDSAIGADSIVSGEGLLNEIRAQPEIFWPLDEMQDMIKNIGGSKAASYSVNVSKYLKVMFSGSDDFRDRVLGSDKEVERKPIGKVYPVIMGASQPQTFWSNVTRNMIADGFIPRFLIFTGDEEILIDTKQLLLEHTSGRIEDPPPEEVISQFKMWTKRREADETLMEIANLPGAVPQTKMQGDHEAFEELAQVMTDIDKGIRVAYKSNELLGQMLGKNTEYLVKLSTIHAWYRCPHTPYLEVQDVQWAVKVLKASNALLRRGLKDFNPTNEFEKNLNQVVQALDKAPDGLTKVGLQARTRNLGLRALEEILGKLFEMEEVFCVERKSVEGRGRPSKVFFHSKYRSIILPDPDAPTAPLITKQNPQERAQAALAAQEKTS